MHCSHLVIIIYCSSLHTPTIRYMHQVPASIFTPHTHTHPDSCPDETEDDVEESNPPDLNAGERSTAHVGMYIVRIHLLAPVLHV